MTHHQVMGVLGEEKAGDDKKLTFVNLFSPECGYCKKFKPIIESLAQELREKITFLEIDLSQDQNRGILKNWQELPVLLTGM